MTNYIISLENEEVKDTFWVFTFSDTKPNVSYVTYSPHSPPTVFLEFILELVLNQSKANQLHQHTEGNKCTTQNTQLWGPQGKEEPQWNGMARQIWSSTCQCKVNWLYEALRNHFAPSVQPHTWKQGKYEDSVAPDLCCFRLPHKPIEACNNNDCMLKYSETASKAKHSLLK